MFQQRWSYQFIVALTRQWLIDWDEVLKRLMSDAEIPEFELFAVEYFYRIKEQHLLLRFDDLDLDLLLDRNYLFSSPNRKRYSFIDHPFNSNVVFTLDQLIEEIKKDVIRAKARQRRVSNIGSLPQVA